MSLDSDLQLSGRRIVSFVLHAGGMGHASRLIAAHTELRDRGFDSVLLVEREQPLISDYGLRQIVIPPHPSSLIDDDWFGSGEKFSALIAKQIIESILAPGDIVLHDVAVYRELYERAEQIRCQQFLIHRARRGRTDPLAWAAATAPAIDTVYILGREGYSAHAGTVRARGISDVVREPLNDKTIWQDMDNGFRVYISPGGGGYPATEAFLNAALEGIASFAQDSIPDISVVIATGPHFGGIVSVPADISASVRITSYIDATHSVYRNTDVAIVHGGYNTVQEIRRIGVRAIAVPGQRPLDDQRGRIEQLAADCPNVVLCELAAGAIRDALQEVSARPSGVIQESPPGAFEVADDIFTRLNR